MTEILYPATSSARKRTIAGVVILALVATAFVRAGLAFPAALSPPAIPTTAYFGARIEPRSGESQSDAVLRVESQIGRRFAIDHYYYQWTDSFPNAAQTWTVGQGRIPFINWKAGGSWSAIANGSQDAVIVAHADAIKSFGYPIYLSFHHEPENDLGSFGSPSDYAAAFRHIVDVFRARGVPNVAFVWTMMAWTFEPKLRAQRHGLLPRGCLRRLRRCGWVQLVPGSCRRSTGHRSKTSSPTPTRSPSPTTSRGWWWSSEHKRTPRYRDARRNGCSTRSPPPRRGPRSRPSSTSTSSRTDTRG